MKAAERASYKKTPLVLSVFRWLSRACLGKILVFSIKWHRKKDAFSYLSLVDDDVSDKTVPDRRRNHRAEPWLGVRGELNARCLADDELQHRCGADALELVHQQPYHQPELRVGVLLLLLWVDTKRHTRRVP